MKQFASNLFSSLRSRPFALLWGGQTASRIGDHLYQIALAWWVLEKTGSASAVGTLLIASFAPMALFLLVGGVAVDRFSRLKIMFVSDVGRGIVAGVLAALAYAGTLRLWHLYAAAPIFGLVDAFFQPAYAAAVPEVTPAEMLPSANSLTSLSQQGGRIAGPPLGAALIALGGTPLAFALNAVSFLIAAGFVVPLLLAPAAAPRPDGSSDGGPEGAPDGPPARRHPWHDLKEGLAVVRRMPWLWQGMLLFAVCNVTLGGPYGVALPFLVTRGRHGGVAALGLLYGMFPVGYALAALATGGTQRPRRRGRRIYGGAIVGGAMILLIGLPLPLAFLAAAAVVNGAALELAGLSWAHLLQERVPANLMGRVSSIDSLGSFVLLPVGYALAGWATDRLGAPAVFVVGGAATVLAAAAGWMLPARAVD